MNKYVILNFKYRLNVNEIYFFYLGFHLLIFGVHSVARHSKPKYGLSSKKKLDFAHIFDLQTIIPLIKLESWWTNNEFLLECMALCKRCPWGNIGGKL